MRRRKMVCHDYESKSERDKREAEQVRSVSRLDEITQNLCFVCGQLLEDDAAMEKYTNPRIQEWWKRHLESDTARVLINMRIYLEENPWITPKEMAAEFIAKALAVHPVSDWHRRWFLMLARRVKGILNKLSAEERKILGM